MPVPSTYGWNVSDVCAVEREPGLAAGGGWPARLVRGNNGAAGVGPRLGSDDAKAIGEPAA